MKEKSINAPSTKLEHILTSMHKESMIAFLKKHPIYFKEALHLAMTSKQPYSWRAAWLLWSVMDPNDKRVKGQVNKILRILPKRRENQQRELLKILQGMTLTANQEGQLFDLCTKLWANTGNAPAVRYNAIKSMLPIAKKHPELAQELRVLLDSRYLDPLTPGARHSIDKMVKGSW